MRYAVLGLLILFSLGDGCSPPPNVVGVQDYGRVTGRVLDAMREDRFHIFSHPEFKEELAEMFAETLEDFRDYPVDPGHARRVEFENTRRASYRQQRRGLKGT